MSSFRKIVEYLPQKDVIKTKKKKKNEYGFRLTGERFDITEVKKYYGNW